MKKKKVLFVFPDISERAWHKGYFHYGLAHVSSYLKEKVTDIEISLLTISDKDFSRDDFIFKIKEFSPEIIGFTSTSHSFPLIQKWAEWVKSLDSNILTVCGGVHVTMNPEEALFSRGVDVVVRGDGEYPMVTLVNEWIEQRKIPDVRGVWYCKDNVIINNGIAIVDDLDLLPAPDWKLFDYANLDDGFQGIGGLMLSRGCPYQCSYCCNSKIADVYRKSNANYIRFKSVEKSITEIKNFIKMFPSIHTLYFDDDILPLKKQWFLEFADRYKREINKPYWCNIRPNLIDEEIVEAFAVSGCVRAGIGIESGNEKIRNEILKRNISEQAFINGISLLKKKKIYVFSFNMVGAPKETKNELLDTIRLNARLNVDKMQCSVFYPYKHTPLYDFVVKEGLLMSEKSLIEYTQESVLKFSYAQRNRIKFTEVTMNLIVKIYRIPPKYIAELFLKILYSTPSAILFLPLLNIIMKRILTSNNLSVKMRRIFRLIILPPPTALVVNNYNCGCKDTE